MMPTNGAKSGTGSRWLNRVTSAALMPTPNRATPTGRPRSRAPTWNATMRMTIAKARPKTSEFGSSSAAKTETSALDLQTLDGRRSVPDRVADLAGDVGLDVLGHIDVREGDLPRFWALRRASTGRPPRRRDFSTRYTPSALRDLGEQRLHRSPNLGTSTPCSARKTIVPTWPPPSPPNAVLRMS